MIEQGQTFRLTFSFTQDEVNEFAKITGDNNPIHVDPVFAANTTYKKPIIHGFLGASLISRVLGMHMPGSGSVYLKQELNFKRPMYVDTEYEVVVTVKETDKQKNIANLETKVVEKISGKPNVVGLAVIMNKEKII